MLTKDNKQMQYNMIHASLGKSLYISITLESAIHHPNPLPPPPPVCLSSLLACYQARYGADGVPPFLIGWLETGGCGLYRSYKCIVAGTTAEPGSWWRRVLGVWRSRSNT